MEINSEKYSLAENKLLILYTLSKVGKPISHNKLQELVISICDMNYFYFQQYLLDLLDDNYVNKYTNNNEDYYELTLEGKEGLELAIDLLPGILKLEVDSKFKKNFDTIRDKSAIIAEYTPISEKEFLVKCKIIENDTTIFNIETYAGSRDQAKQMVNNWNKRASEIYPEILNILAEEE